MIEIRQDKVPPPLDAVLSSMSAASAAAASASIEQADTALDVPTTSTAIVDGPTLPATINPGEAPSNASAATPAPATDTSSSSSDVTLSEDSSSNSGGGLSNGSKVGLGVGLGVGLSLLIVLIAVLCLMRRRKRRQGQMGKYTPQAQSDLSMVEAPHAMAAAQNRHLPPEYEPPKQYNDYHEYEAPHQHEEYETPISAVAPAGTQIPLRRSMPEAPPVLTIPTPDRSPLHSIVPSIVPSPAHGGSPVSPVSMSPVSPIGSRPPSPKHGQ